MPTKIVNSYADEALIYFQLTERHGVQLREGQGEAGCKVDTSVVK